MGYIDKSIRYVKIALIICCLLVFGYILIGEFAFPANTPKSGLICETLPGDAWYLVQEDGTRVPFAVPGRVDGDAVLETVIPEDLSRDVNVLCFRGMDMEIYVDGVLREKYATQDYALLGDRSAECYVCASVYPEDAGKTLTVHYEYNSGMIYEVYAGTRIGIITWHFKRYGAELFVGLAILMLGIISFVSSVIYRWTHRKYLEMEDLALGVVCGGIWVMSNSIFRQFYTRNMSVMSDIPFLMVILMPLPFLIFINSLQEKRYQKVILFAILLELADFVVCIGLFVTGIVPLVRSFVLAAGCALVSILVIAYTLIRDLIVRRLKGYRLIAAGFAFLAISAVSQIMMYQFAHNGVFSGFLMAVGLFGFMICAVLHTIKQLINIRVVATEAVHASKAKDEFLANMSHEIRTPLNGILGMDEMIIRDTKEPQTRRYAADIKSAGNTLLSLINDILDLSKIEAGSLTLTPQKYGVASVLNDVINLTRHRAVAKKLDYRIDIAEDIPSFLVGDEIRVRQVMLNIVNNAVKYTAKGYVELRVRAERTAASDEILLRISVQDTGIGIRPEERDKLFRSFQRLDEKRNRNIEGTGLGLHITYRLVQMMGGSIEVESEYGSGSTFTLIIPQRVANPSPIGEFSKAVSEHAKTVTAEETTLYAPGASLLIVDDNEMNLEVLRGLLRDTKASVTSALSGRECIAKAKQKHFDVILLDQMMPEMNGEATLRELQNRDLIGDTPVIALTADAIVGAKEHYISLGFTDYLSKPIRYEKLEEALKKYIPKKKQLEKRPEEDRLPVMLLWGTDAERLREEKARLEGIYKCVCVTGTAARDKYLAGHTPDAVTEVLSAREAAEGPGEEQPAEEK